MILINSTNLMAQCTMPFSVGGSALESSTTNSDSFDNKNTESTKSSDTQQINGCGDEPPMEEVVVYGHATSFSWGFIRFWWSPSPGGNGGGGSGNGDISFGEVDANKECQALGVEERVRLLNAAFIAARSFNANNIGAFLREHYPHSIFSVTLPNGSIMRGIVSGAFLPVPILAEAPKSCG